MLIDTSRIPLAACGTLRVISWVAAVCSSAAEAIEFTTRMGQGNDSVASLAEAAQRLGEVVS
jgi:hypothetical protein